MDTNFKYYGWHHEHIHEALDQLEQEDPAKAQLVKLGYFAGMSLEQASTAMGISRATASRHWTYAKAWLGCALEEQRPV